MFFLYYKYAVCDAKSMEMTAYHGNIQCNLRRRRRGGKEASERKLSGASCLTICHCRSHTSDMLKQLP